MAMMTYEELSATLGSRIREARKKAGMSTEELCAKVYASNRSIQSYESGKIIPNLVMVCNLAKVLGVTVGWLIAGEEA